MLKFTLAAAFVLVAMPALAAENLVVKCDDNTMMRLDKIIEGTSDAAKKEVAIKEVNMAKESMKNSRFDECMVHMRSAYDSTK
jgi:hypothetical protein